MTDKIDDYKETEEHKKMMERFHRMAERLSKTYDESYKEMDQPGYSSIYRRPRRFKLTEEERREIPKKFEEYIRIQDNAIDIVKKHIKRLENEKDPIKNEWILYKLNQGLRVLVKGKEVDLKGGVEDFIGVLERYKRGRRPGLGLYKGFSEFISAIPPEEGEWPDEILDAVEEIEIYFNNV